jgi:hypothetical protein
MWIAKPIRALSKDERSEWISCRGDQPSTPLSQTLAWAEAIESVGARAFLVFSPDERVGGVVHSSDALACDFECVNGPLLDWDDAEKATRQLATFAMAVAKLSHTFKSLQLQPRWLSQEIHSRIEHLPIEPREILRAATLQVPVKASVSDQFKSLSPRLRRTLSRAQCHGVRVQTRPIDLSELGDFVSSARRVGESKGFFVPAEGWFRALIGDNPEEVRESLAFWITRAHVEGSRTSLLTCVHGKTAHYLLGFDERAHGAPSSLSTSAVAHFDVLEHCAESAIEIYDMNGFTDPSDQSHPYSGVSRFKAQFSGTPIEYASPLLIIEA